MILLISLILWKFFCNLYITRIKFFFVFFSSNFARRFLNDVSLNGLLRSFLNKILYNLCWWMKNEWLNIGGKLLEVEIRRTWNSEIMNVDCFGWFMTVINFKIFRFNFSFRLFLNTRYCFVLKKLIVFLEIQQFQKIAFRVLHVRGIILLLYLKYEALLISNIIFLTVLFSISSYPSSLKIFFYFKATKIFHFFPKFPKLEKYKVSSISISIVFSTNDNSETIEQNARRQTLEQTTSRCPLSIRVELCLRTERRETRVSASKLHHSLQIARFSPQLATPKDKIIWSSHLGCSIDIVLLAEYTAIDGTVQPCHK